jgi:hypothetical protein
MAIDVFMTKFLSEKKGLNDLTASMGETYTTRDEQFFACFANIHYVLIRSDSLLPHAPSRVETKCFLDHSVLRAIVS